MNISCLSQLITFRHKYSDKTVLIMYGGPGEQHEMAFACESATIERNAGYSTTITNANGTAVINWHVQSTGSTVKVGDRLYVYLVDRNTAYNHWVLPLAGGTSNNTFTDNATSAVIVEAGYLLRSAEVSGCNLALTGDVNATTSITVLGGAPSNLRSLTFNGECLDFIQDTEGVVKATAMYNKPNFTIPDLSSLTWRYIDSLPELRSYYNDERWTAADLATTNNTIRKLTTPTSLYGSDYGYNVGSLQYRGHFIATGAESRLYLQTQGGSAFGMAAFLNQTFLGSYPGIDRAAQANTTFTLPALTAGTHYTITVVIDHMGLNEDFTVGSEDMKNPRGILDYTLSGREKSAITWKLTGNLGGEDYRDRIRGPLNEGSFYVERQGYHLPNPPLQQWRHVKPTQGIDHAGIGFFVTSFDLDMPRGYDIPLSFRFSNSSSTAAAAAADGTRAAAYRCQLFVNGYQFGKYVHNVGPQDRFPVPEGILNYHGANWVGVTLWSLEDGGAKIEGLELVAGPVIQSGYGEVRMSPVDEWKKREGAY